MTTQEVLTIRKYAEGAYPQLKSNDGSDLVWVDLLKPFEALGIMKALKDYIMAGNKFPPTVAELIQGYKTVLSEIDESIVQMMLEAGDFDDPDWTDHEIAEQNRKQRTEKTRNFIQRGIMPDWLRERYDHFKRLASQQYFQMPMGNQKQIGGAL